MKMFERVKIRCIGDGVVAEDLKNGSDTIAVWPKDQLPEAQGELSDSMETVELSFLDNQGKTKKVTVNRSLTIPAKWGGQTNRVTPPNVRRGERVRLWRVMNSDKYYWQSKGLDDNLRRLEVVIYAWNGSPLNDDTALSIDNCYYLEINTQRGFTHYHTSKVNGEYTSHSIVLDGANGQAWYEDDFNNHAFIDSKRTLVELLNGDKTIFQLDRKKIYAYAEEEIHLKTKKMTVETDSVGWTNANAYELTTGTWANNVSQTADLKASGTVTINGSTVNMN